jgi:FAD/FMN-containing dehydrogenase
MSWRDERLPACEQLMLPYGNGRSYGDSCLNDNGTLLDMRGLDRFIHFDRITGVITCEAGVLFSQVLDLVVPAGWFPPVTPGTRLVTVGGAIANDVHGKNHHRAGTLGRHVRAFELLRSDGSRRVCTPRQNADWYAATIGGLGLTGAIVWAEIALKPVPGPLMAMETLRTRCLDEFFELSAASDADYDYTVAWVDCLASGPTLGRGLFTRANHAPGSNGRAPQGRRWRPGIPFTPPFSVVNEWSLPPLNALYYHRQLRNRVRSLSGYEPFFYPLDGILNWNRLYGPSGFLQYQCVVPTGHGPRVIRALLQRISRANAGSLVSVLKVFGDKPSPGWLSFPRPGVTLALDFPHRGARTLSLLEELDDLVAEAGGAVYPAKDARMTAERFQQFFPDWERLREYVDPAFSSNLWRRVGGAAP